MWTPRRTWKGWSLARCALASCGQAAVWTIPVISTLFNTSSNVPAASVQISLDMRFLWLTSTLCTALSALPCEAIFERKPFIVSGIIFFAVFITAPCLVAKCNNLTYVHCGKTNTRVYYWVIFGLFDEIQLTIVR